MSIPVGDLIDHVISTELPGFVFREGQREPVEKILDLFINQDVKYVNLDAPTGSGKSYIAYIISACMNMFEKINCEDEELRKSINTMFLTKTIGLQHQYAADFSRMTVLKSASNYSCHTDETLPINPKLKNHESCKYTRDSGMCEYAVAKRAFNKSDMKLLNYAYYITYQRNSVNPIFSNLLIVDEGHTLPNYLIDFSTIELNFEILSKHAEHTKNVSDYFSVGMLNRLDILDQDSLNKILDYCFDAMTDLSERIQDVEEQLESMSTGGHSIVELIEKSLKPLNSASNYFSDLGGKLHLMLRSAKSENWIQEKKEIQLQTKTNTVFEFKSLQVETPMLDVLKDNSKYMLIMSGTCGRLVQDLMLDGINVVHVPYTFPLENRPFIALSDLPPMNYSTRESVLPIYLNKIDDLLEMMMDDCGLIHSVSYDNARYIKENSRFSDRIYIPTKEEVRDIKTVVKKGRVLVSPAMIEGVDLKGDMASFQIFLKVPYPSLGSKWMKVKAKEDADWYAFEALVSILQGSGRAIRTKEDTAVTFMLDPSFSNLYKRTKHHIPEWFAKTINWS